VSPDGAATVSWVLSTGAMSDAAVWATERRTSSVHASPLSNPQPAELVTQGRQNGAETLYPMLRAALRQST
jgi:hypothetical protein